MTITEMLKPETIECHFTFEELVLVHKALEHCVAGCSGFGQASNVLDLIGDKLNHEQDMKIMESARWHENALKRLQDAFSYNTGQYVSRYAR